jgi:hypothetical protein
MKYGLSIRSYKGMHFVEFNTKSVGMTLLATWDKKQAEDELRRFQGMSEAEFKEAVLKEEKSK